MVALNRLGPCCGLEKNLVVGGIRCVIYWRGFLMKKHLWGCLCRKQVAGK